MSAYVIGDINVTDPETYAKYAAGVPATVAAFGGTYLIRGASGEVFEGSWAPKRLVVLEFESINRVKEWYNSPEYQAVIGQRFSTSDSNLIFVDGA